MKISKKTSYEVDTTIKVYDRFVSSNSGESMNKTATMNKTGVVPKTSPFHYSFVTNLESNKKENVESMLKQVGKTHKKRDKIIFENLWLVSYLSKPYQYLMNVNDLHSAGLAGLIEGIKNLDEKKMKEKNTKPSTYLRWWVLQSIKQTLYKNRNVVIPTDKIIQQTRKNHNLDENNFSEEDFVYPEISLNFSTNGSFDGNEQDVTDWYIYNNSEEGYIEDSSQNVEKNDLINKIQDTFNEETSLTKEERKILTHRFGLKNQEGDYEEPKTLREIASITGMSYEGVRKIEIRALKKLGKNFKNMFVETDL